ncbi:MAG: hypothetical protein WAT14_05560 [Chitinophagaceae bacterium]
MMDKEYLKATSVGELQQQLNDMITKRKQVRDNLAFAEERFKVLENNYLNKQSGFFNKLFTKKDTVENIGIELEDYRAQVSLLKEELSFLRIDVDGLHQDITLTTLLLADDLVPALLVTVVIFHILLLLHTKPK